MTHGYRAPATEESAHVLRLRQSADGCFVEGSLRQVTLADGVSATVGRPRLDGKAEADEVGFVDAMKSAKKDLKVASRSARISVRSVTRSVKKLVGRASRKVSRRR